MWRWILALSLAGCAGGKPAVAPVADDSMLAAEASGDADGIHDDEDRCPSDTEDFDNFEDSDGCPDPDNDGDGVLDGDDKCPLDAEDKDAFEDEDGCPESDNDRDGIRDAEDKCPIEPGPGDGCPTGEVKPLRLDPVTPPPPASTPKPVPAQAPAPAPAPAGRAIADATQSSWVVAVMTVENSGASQLKEPLRRGLTDQLRVFLGSRRMKVVPSGAMEAAFREIMAAEKAKSYGSCVDDACQIPLGKALAASHILRTTIGRFGSGCTVNAELIDLAREVSRAAVSTRAGCKDDELLDASEKLMDELLRESR